MCAIHHRCLLGILLLLALAGAQRADARQEGKQTAGGGGSPRSADKASVDRLRTAIERAAGYLGTRQQSGNGAWFTTQAAILLSPKFKAWARTLKVSPSLVAVASSDSPKTFLEAAEASLWSLRWLPERPAVQLPKPNPTPVDRAESRRFEESETMLVIVSQLASATCHEFSPQKQHEWLAMLAWPAHSYSLTNQLLSLMLGYNNGCLTQRVTTPHRRRLATQVYAELIGDMDTLDALAIERMALLSYARVGDWIAPGLIARLVGEQQPSGSWGARDPHVFKGYRATDEFTTALSFYVLARSWALHHASAPAPMPPKSSN
jgi:hypothetical protein